MSEIGDGVSLEEEVILYVDGSADSEFAREALLESDVMFDEVDMAGEDLPLPMVAVRSPERGMHANFRGAASIILDFLVVYNAAGSGRLDQR